MKQFLSILLALCLLTALLIVPASAMERGMPFYDEVIVSSGEEWTVEENYTVGHLEIEDGGVVQADHPVIVFYEESGTVENGQVIGEVQFVSDYDEVVALVHTNDVHGYIDVEPYVKECLMSVMNQSFKDWECIIGIETSKDKTEDERCGRLFGHI